MRGSAAFRVAVAPGGALAGPWVRNSLWTAARAVPSLDLRFAANKSLVDAVTGAQLVTFTRASTGTYVGSDGLLKSAATNEPRFDHNPTTGESLGLLVEEARTNVVTWSQDFSQTDWTKAASTVVSTAVASPIQGVNYQKIEATSANTTVGVTSIAVTAATQQRAVSFFAQPLGNISRVLVVIQGIDARINVNLVDGTFTTNAIAAGSTVSVSGQRFSVSTPTLTLATGVRFFLKRTGETDTNTPTTIAIGEGLYLTGAQLEAGAFPTSYIPTVAATVTRAADVASITGSNFTSFYNQTEGTVFAEANVLSSSYSAGVLWDIGAGGAFGSTEYIGWIGTGWQLGPNAAPINVASSVSATLPSRTATAIKLNDSIISASGLLGALDTSCTVPASALALTIGKGGWSGAGNYVNGTIKRLTYWPTRFANTTHQQITQP